METSEPAVPPVGDVKLERDWTHKLESWKIYLYLLEIIIIALLVVMSVIDDAEMLEKNRFDLPKLLVPLSILVGLIGVEEVLFRLLIGKFRKDLADRYRFLEVARRGAIGAAIASFIIFGFIVAPPLHNYIENRAGRDVVDEDKNFFYTLESSDFLNLTTLKEVRLTTEEGVEFDIAFYRGDSLDNGVLLEEETDVEVWEHGFSGDLALDYLINTNEFPNDVVWVMERETAIRPYLIQGVAIPFLILGVLNIVWFPIARFWALRSKDAYVSTTTVKLRARFKVEEAFLIYEDGRLISHNSRRLKPERDKDILTGMLTAVQSFVTDTFMDEERGTLDQLKYGTLSILVEGHGKVNLACIVSGDESPVLRQGMKNIVTYIGQHYRQLLEYWDGDIEQFKDVKRYIGHLVSTGKEEPVYPDELFLIHRDGRLVAHQTSRLEPSIDDDLLQQWVDLVVGQVGQRMEDPNAPMISFVDIKGYKVLVEYTNYLMLAYMTMNKETEELRELMLELMQDIDAQFRSILYEWDGVTHELTDVKTMMEIVLESGEEKEDT